MSEEHAYTNSYHGGTTENISHCRPCKDALREVNQEDLSNETTIECNRYTLNDEISKELNPQELCSEKIRNTKNETNKRKHQNTDVYNKTEVRSIGTRERSRREVKPTSKFKEYLMYQKSIPESDHENFKNDTEVVPSENKTNSRKERAIQTEIERKSCKAHCMEDKQIMANSRAKKLKTESPALAKDIHPVKPLELPADNKSKFEDKPNDRNTEKVLLKVKRSTGHKLKKDKKYPIIPVKLEEYPDSFCIEKYPSFNSKDKGKSDLEKMCQRYLCKLCNNYRTVIKEEIEKHISLHVNQRLNCQFCDFIASSEHNLSFHIRKEHQKGVFYICELCGADFSDRRRHTLHLTKVHKQAAHRCGKCSKTFVSNTEYREHRLNEHKDGAFKCEKCGSIFLQKKLLENHVNKSVCEVKALKCQYCGGMKKSQQLLNEHIKRVHSKEHQFKCNLCSFSSAMNYVLKDHMNSHLGIRPHKCEKCKFSCVKKYQLVSHMRTHTGERKYKCEKCNFAGAWNVQLKKHMKAHESDKQISCQICNIVFVDQRNLGIHVKKKHTSHLPKKAKLPTTANPSNFKSDIMVPVEGTRFVFYTMEGAGVEAKKMTSSYVEENIVQTFEEAKAMIRRDCDSSSSVHGEERKRDDSAVLYRLHENTALNAYSEVQSGGNKSANGIAGTDQLDRIPNVEPVLRSSGLDDQTGSCRYVAETSMAIPTDSTFQADNGIKSLMAGLVDVPPSQSCIEKVGIGQDPGGGSNVLHTKSDSINCSADLRNRTMQYDREISQLVESHTLIPAEKHSTRQLDTSQLIYSADQSVLKLSSDNSVELERKTSYESDAPRRQASLLTESSPVTPKPSFRSIHPKNNVTFLRMHTNQDGSRRFESVDPKVIYAAMQRESVGKSVSDSPTSSVSEARSNVQDAHNYAVPAHKQKKQHGATLAPSVKQFSETAVNMQTVPVEKQVSLPSDQKAVSNSSTELLPDTDNCTDIDNTTFIHFVTMDEPDTVVEVVTDGEEVIAGEYQEITSPV